MFTKQNIGIIVNFKVTDFILIKEQYTDLY